MSGIEPPWPPIPSASEIEPGGVDTFYLDFTNELQSGETIASASVAESDTLAILTPGTATIAGNVVSSLVAVSVGAQQYQVATLAFSIVTSLNAHKTRSLQIPIGIL